MAAAGDLDQQAPANALTIAAIFRAHGEAFRHAHTLSDEQRHAMWSIEHCRTATLGGHRYQCTTCATAVPLYNSCLSRFCPTCQGPAQYKWIAQRYKRLLPTHYFHLGFTLPAPLRPLAMRSPRLIFDLLFAAAAQTLLDNKTFRQLITRLKSQPWVVYAKPPFDGPPQIVNYLGRYTHRTGIANSRLVSISADAVSFRTKNDNTCTLPPQEFIRRFLLHILPRGYTKIRHYGLLAAGNVNTKLVRARELLEQHHPPMPAPATTASAREGAAAPGDGTTADPAKPKLRCPNCAGTVFILLGPLPPARRRRNHPPPHT